MLFRIGRIVRHQSADAILGEGNFDRPDRTQATLEYAAELTERFLGSRFGCGNPRHQNGKEYGGEHDCHHGDAQQRQIQYAHQNNRSDGQRGC
eukprot:gene21342-25638_t